MIGALEIDWALPRVQCLKWDLRVRFLDWRGYWFNGDTNHVNMLLYDARTKLFHEERRLCVFPRPTARDWVRVCMDLIEERSHQKLRDGLGPREPRELHLIEGAAAYAAALTAWEKETQRCSS